MLHYVTNDETVGADLCVCPETSTSASGRTRRSAPTASSSNRFTQRVMGTQNDKQNEWLGERILLFMKYRMSASGEYGTRKRNDCIMRLSEHESLDM